MNNDLQKEIQQVHTDCYSMAKKPLKEVLKAYKTALDDVQKELALIAHKYEVDGVLNISSKQRYSVLKSVEDQLIKQAKELGQFNVDKTTELLTNIYSESYYRTEYIIDKGITANINFSLLRPEMIKAAINTPIDNITFSKRIWTNQKALTDRLYKDIRKALVNGKSTEKLARQIKKDFGVTSYRASRLINNEVSRAVNIAQDEIYNNSSVVKELLFDAVLDGKTSAICQNLDGKRFPKDNHISIPDNTHVGCRSCWIPVVDGWKPTRKLENIKDEATGKKNVIDYTTYDKWKKSKGI